MAYAVIGKWNNLVKEVNETSLNLDGSSNLYEVETSFVFNQPYVMWSYRYDGVTFEHIDSFPVKKIEDTWRDEYSDYKAARAAMIASVASIGFSNLSLRDKKIASKWFAVTKADRDTVHTLEEQIAYGKDFHLSSVKARRARLTAVKMEIYNRLTYSQVNDIMVASNFEVTGTNYVELGREGTEEGNAEGLFDYIEARLGTLWELTGLKVQAYIPLGMANCTELSTRLMDILKNGNY